MFVYLIVADGLRIIKPFIYKPSAEKYRDDWNADPDNKTDQCHIEPYKIDQEGKDQYRRG